MNTQTTGNPPDVEHSTAFFPNSSATMNLETGAAPFTIEMWVRVDALGPDRFTAFIYGQAANSFIIGVQNTSQGPFYYAEARGQSIVGPSVIMGEWVHLALTYDGQAITLIADAGAYQSLALFLAPADVIVVGQQAGTSAQFSVSDVALWSVVRTTLQIAQDMWADPSTGDAGLVFYGDFTANTPTDVFGSPILVTGTGFNSETPNVRNLGTGYLLPAAASDLNPNFAAPFTLSLWTRAIPGAGAANQVIYGNGDSASTGSWMIWYSSVGVGVNVMTSQGLQGVLALGLLPLDAWTHLAVTWDGTTCTMYVDGVAGVASNSSTLATTPSVPTGQSILFNQMTNGVPTAPYAGHIQSMACWSICLTPDQVQASMNVDPSNDPACTAFFACSINPPADLSGLGGTGVSGQDLLQFVGTGVSFDQVGFDSVAAAEARGEESAPTGDAPASPMGRSRPTSWEPVGKAPRRKFLGRVSHNVQAFEPFSDAHAARMKRDMRATLVQVRDPDARKRTIAEFDTKLHDVFSRARADPASVPQPFTYERVDDRWVVYMHGENGTQVFAEYDATITPVCVVWWVTFIATVISGLLRLSGISIVPARLQALIDSFVFDVSFTAALTIVVAPGMSATALLGVVAVLYQFGLLGKAFWLAFSSLSWWAAGKAVLMLVGYVAPPPILTPQQAMLVKNTIVLVAQLTVQLAGFSSACPSQQEDRRPSTAPRPLEYAVAG